MSRLDGIKMKPKDNFSKPLLIGAALASAITLSSCGTVSMKDSIPEITGHNLLKDFRYNYNGSTRPSTFGPGAAVGNIEITSSYTALGIKIENHCQFYVDNAIGGVAAASAPLSPGQTFLSPFNVNFKGSIYSGVPIFLYGSSEYLQRTRFFLFGAGGKINETVTLHQNQYNERQLLGHGTFKPRTTCQYKFGEFPVVDRDFYAKISYIGRDSTGRLIFDINLGNGYDYRFKMPAQVGSYQINAALVNTGVKVGGSRMDVGYGYQQISGYYIKINRVDGYNINANIDYKGSGGASNRIDPGTIDLIVYNHNNLSDRFKLNGGQF